MKELFGKFINLLIFQEQSAHQIRTNPSHDDHTVNFNERYWHGFEVGVRYARNRLRDFLEEYEKYIEEFTRGVHSSLEKVRK